MRGRNRGVVSWEVKGEVKGELSREVRGDCREDKSEMYGLKRGGVGGGVRLKLFISRGLILGMEGDIIVVVLVAETLDVEPSVAVRVPLEVKTAAREKGERQ